MRASEFVFRESNNSLGDALRAMALQNQQKTQPGQKDLNAKQTPQPAQGTQGSVPATGATSGGTQTPQNGVNQTASGPAGAQKPGIIGNFISGLTKGKADSIGGAAKLGAAGLAKGAGLDTMAGQIQQIGSNPAQQSNIFAKPGDVGASLKPGSTIKLPNVGDIKVGKITPQGIELDTSKAPSIGVPKLTINPKDLTRK